MWIAYVSTAAQFYYFENVPHAKYRKIIIYFIEIYPGEGIALDSNMVQSVSPSMFRPNYKD